MFPNVCMAGQTAALAISFAYYLENLALFVYLVLLQHMLTVSGYKHDI